MDFDKDKLKLLKRAYNDAVGAEKEMFTFEGQVLLCSYAKYLIEYLKGALK